MQVSPDNSHGQMVPYWSITGVTARLLPTFLPLSTVVTYGVALTPNVHLEGDYRTVFMVHPHVWDTAQTSKADSSYAVE